MCDDMLPYSRKGKNMKKYLAQILLLLALVTLIFNLVSGRRFAV